MEYPRPGGVDQVTVPAFPTAARDGQIQFVGYGPSASTIGATRAGRVAATVVRDRLVERLSATA